MQKTRRQQLSPGLEILWGAIGKNGVCLSSYATRTRRSTWVTFPSKLLLSQCWSFSTNTNSRLHAAVRVFWSNMPRNSFRIDSWLIARDAISVHPLDEAVVSTPKVGLCAALVVQDCRADGIGCGKPMRKLHKWNIGHDWELSWLGDKGNAVNGRARSEEHTEGKKSRNNQDLCRLGTKVLSRVLAEDPLGSAYQTSFQPWAVIMAKLSAPYWSLSHMGPQSDSGFSSSLFLLPILS
jgi:hypothetical protein